MLDNLLIRLKNFFTSRLFVVAILCIVMFSALIARLFKLQIVEGANYQETFIETSTKTVSQDYTRGSIYDRNGKPLAYNQLSYNVTIVDDGTYTPYNRNLMIVRLINILSEHEETFKPALSIECVDGQYAFTASTERALRRFLIDVGVMSTSEDATTDQSHDVSWYTPDYVVDKLCDRYGYGITVSGGQKKETYTLSNEDRLKLVDVRYALSLNSGQKYVAATVSTDVSEETVADILEHEYDLSGVSIETESVRTYEDAQYFAPIIGYTGEVSSEDLQKLDKSYSLGDVVGKAGIEYSYESVLKGEKGSKTIVVDNQGIIRSVESEDAPAPGNDVYLTIDRDLQVAVYNLLEQHLAGILESKIVNYDYEVTSNTVSSAIMIPVKSVYYQLINNNILDMDEFAADDASATEKQIYKKFKKRSEKMLDEVSEIMLDENSKNNDAYSENVAKTLNYVFSILNSEEIIKSDSLDTSSQLYKQWVNDQISLRAFLMSALTQGWIDVTRLNLSSRYADTTETMEALVAEVRELLSQDETYAKMIYKFLIDDETLSGAELCVALFDQKVIKYKKSDYNRLLGAGSTTAYNFIKEKIVNLEITPAQLALDPCSGSVVITDTDTGDVLALVTYPSYDNNRITTDSSYLASLTSNQSLPLYNRATQTRTAPGSIYKPIMALAAVKEGVLGVDELIQTAANGTFEEAGYTLKCWIAPGNHGKLGIVGALKNSCNYFFGELAYRLSLTSSGNYSENKGIATIQKYSEMFGLGENSGIEISEASPHVTDAQTVASGIGQGTHNYTNTQINRYVTALATKGTVLDLNLVSKTTDSQGNLKDKSEKEVVSKAEFSSEAWKAVYEGMHEAVYSSKTYAAWFADLDCEVAGKTGTAQEDKKRGNHANFICFAPYDDPEVAISVSIPFGYTAANSVSVAADCLKYYYGKISLKTILHQSAQSTTGTDITD